MKLNCFIGYLYHPVPDPRWDRLNELIAAYTNEGDVSFVYRLKKLLDGTLQVQYNITGKDVGTQHSGAVECSGGTSRIRRF